VYVRRLGRQADRPADLQAVALRVESCLHGPAEEGSSRLQTRLCSLWPCSSQMTHYK
jgi:hypothetical protein